jgi:hypothetical protein
MDSRSFTAGCLAVLAALVVVAPVEAQIGTPPPVHAPIRSARRAANAASAHVEAEQRPTMSTASGKTAKSTRTPVVADATPPARRSPSAAGGKHVQVAGDAAPAGADSSEITIVREHFSYPDDGRRDPFVSLIASGELRPMITDLKLVAIIYDPAGRSVAVLRDLTTDDQYRVRVGSTLGRMRVAGIHPKSVTFTIEEFGYSRQAVLALEDDSTKQ